jgi:DNA polymerase I
LTLYFDIETADSKKLFTYEGDSYVRLCGAANEHSLVAVTADPERLIEALYDAEEIVGHNIMAFDLIALCWHYDLDWDELAGKARDTLILARLKDPPRSRETGGSIDRYDLGHVADKLDIGTKSDELKRLKREFKGYDRIPTGDPRYRGYLAADVELTREVARHYPMTEYAEREHELATIAGRMTLNGFKVQRSLLARRIREGAEQKQEALSILNEDFGLPLDKTVLRGRNPNKYAVKMDFASPLSTNEGREWLIGKYAELGVADYPLSPKTRKPSISAEALTKWVESVPQEMMSYELGDMIALMNEVTTVRTVYQTVDNCLTDAGRVHPVVSMGQASGRWSVTNPGLTVFGKRDGRHHEREIFIPESGHSLITCDLSQVDMRGIAGLCQDRAYMKLFEPGRDVHTEIAEQLFGDPDYREKCKRIGHGYNYGLGKNKMIFEWGIDPDLVERFFAGMAKRFPVLMAWRRRIRARGERGMLLDNGFGRKMRCDPMQAYTQAPALMGQGSARDIMGESLLRLPSYLDMFLRVMVHDEIVMSVPTKSVKVVKEDVEKAFTWEWRGVPILCDITGPGENWGKVSAK